MLLRAVSVELEAGAFSYLGGNLAEKRKFSFAWEN